MTTVNVPSGSKQRSGPSTTSERVELEAYQGSPGDYLIACMHIATYDFASPYVQRADVLDFGCGTGYGADRLAPIARSITGIDISRDAIAYAKRRWSRNNLTFRRTPPIEDAPLPFADDSFDTVLSFQVIEHVPDVDRYLAEVRRVLRPDGTFLCATPDRRHRLYPHQRPWNEFHLEEWTEDEVVAILEGVFDVVESYGMTTAPRQLLDLELSRYALTRRLTLPFTFSRAPEWWRRAGLRLLKRLKPSGRSASTSPSSFGFGPDNVVIDSGVDPSVNVITVAL